MRSSGPAWFWKGALRGFVTKGGNDWASDSRRTVYRGEFGENVRDWTETSDNQRVQRIFVAYCSPVQIRESINRFPIIGLGVA